MQPLFKHSPNRAQHYPNIFFTVVSLYSTWVCYSFIIITLYPALWDDNTEQDPLVQQSNSFPSNSPCQNLSFMLHYHVVYSSLILLSAIPRNTALGLTSAERIKLYSVFWKLYFYWCRWKFCLFVSHCWLIFVIYYYIFNCNSKTSIFHYIFWTSNFF